MVYTRIPTAMSLIQNWRSKAKELWTGSNEDSDSSVNPNVDAVAWVGEKVSFTSSPSISSAWVKRSTSRQGTLLFEEGNRSDRPGEGPGERVSVGIACLVVGVVLIFLQVVFRKLRKLRSSLYNSY